MRYAHLSPAYLSAEVGLLVAPVPPPPVGERATKGQRASKRVRGPEKVVEFAKENGSSGRIRTYKPPVTGGKETLAPFCRSLREVAGSTVSPNENQSILAFALCRGLLAFDAACCGQRTRTGPRGTRTYRILQGFRLSLRHVGSPRLSRSRHRTPDGALFPLSGHRARREPCQPDRGGSAATLARR
jgi:hypothetical protein